MRKSGIGPQALILSVYFVLPFLFFGIGVDLTKTAVALGDSFLDSFPSKIFASTLSLWNPYIQAGRFTIPGIPHQSAYLPGLLILRIFPDPFGYNLFLFLHYALAGFFTYLFCSSLRLNRVSSFIGGLIFMFSGFLCAHKAHHSMVCASIWLPLILYCIEKYLEKRKFSILLGSSLAFAFCIFADYWALPMYTAMVAFPYLAFRLWQTHSHEKGGPVKYVTGLVVSSIIIFGGSLLLSAAQVLPIMECLKYVTRESISPEFFMEYSFPPIALPLLFFPNLFGSMASTFYSIEYFGPWNQGELTGYLGILPVIFALFAVALCRKEGKQVLFWTFIALFGFLLVLGNSTPLYKYLYYVPIYNKFRVPARNWFEVNFAVTILCSFFIHCAMTKDVLQRSDFRWARRLAIAGLAIVVVVIWAGVFLVRLLYPFFNPDVFNRHPIFPGNYIGFSSMRTVELFISNTDLRSPAMYVPLLVIAVSVVFLLLLKYCRKRYYWSLLAGFIFLDLFSFGHFHNNYYPDYSFLDNKDSVESYKFLRETEPDLRSFRILSLDDYNYGQLWPNTNMYFGVLTPNAYAAFWLKDYSEMTSFLSSGYCSRCDVLLESSSVFSLLSVKYILTADSRKKAQIESFSGTITSKSPETILDGSSFAGWEFWQPLSHDETAVTLKSKYGTGKQSSLMQCAFQAEKDAYYKITLEARSSLPSNEPHLVVDLAGYPRYELFYSPLTHASFGPSSIGPTYGRVTASFRTPGNIPDKVFLRIYTFKPVPVEIRNVRLERMYPVTYWGDRQQGMTDYPKYRQRHQNRDGTMIYENMNFLPRARFVEHIRTVNDFREANNILWNEKEFNPSTTALVEGYHGVEQMETGEVLRADYSINDSLSLSVITGNTGFLVLSDTWYPGWEAYVDGKETKIYRTNGTLRGIFIEGRGKHSIVFLFKPRSFYFGLFLSVAGLLSVCCVVLYDIRSTVRAHRKKLES